MGWVAGRTTVIVPTYEDSELTTACVESLTASGGDLEIIVWDNGSSPDVAAALDRLAGARVQVHRSEENHGFALGNNLGLAHATGDVVVFLNNDTTVGPGWLAPLRDALEAWNPGEPAPSGFSKVFLQGTEPPDYWRHAEDRGRSFWVHTFHAEPLAQTGEGLVGDLEHAVALNLASEGKAEVVVTACFDGEVPADTQHQRHVGYVFAGSEPTEGDFPQATVYLVHGKKAVELGSYRSVHDVQWSEDSKSVTFRGNELSDYGKDDVNEVKYEVGAASMQKRNVGQTEDQPSG